MNQQFDRLRISLFVFFILQLVIVLLGYFFFFNLLYILEFVLLIVNGFVLFVTFIYYQEESTRRAISIQSVLGKESMDAFLYGKIALVTYDENNLLEWMSELFDDDQLLYLGQRVTTWIPDLLPLIKGSVDEMNVVLQDKVYTVARHPQARLLLFKDITQEQEIRTQYEANQVVLGLIHLDNYDDETQYEDEQQIGLIDLQLRQPVVNWAKENGMYLRRLRPDRFLVVLNEEIFEKIVEDGFSISNYIRKTADKYDLAITLSMGFGRGSQVFSELEDMSNRALALAQGRGGDQIAVMKQGEDIVYYGSSSETAEKGSKVRVRVMAHSIRDLAMNSQNVLIVGHSDMDFDCFGAAIGMSRIIQSYQRNTFIVLGNGGIESKLEATIEAHYEHLQEGHRFVDESSAKELIRPNTLLIMVDHHLARISNSPELIPMARKIAIIDHHRRMRNFEFNPILAYIETSSSSTTEMVTEFFNYQRKDVTMSSLEATIMLAGMIVDTNHFRTHTGTRTFEAASVLKDMGADPTLADRFLRDDFDEFDLRSKMLSRAELHGPYIIAAIEDIVSRTMVAQVANQLLQIQGVEASFVIAPLDQQVVSLSARSNGQVNVQLIMENMGGGGHFTVAAVQKKKPVKEVKAELIETLEEFDKIQQRMNMEEEEE